MKLIVNCLQNENWWNSIQLQAVTISTFCLESHAIYNTLSSLPPIYKLINSLDWRYYLFPHGQQREKHR